MKAHATRVDKLEEGNQAVMKHLAAIAKATNAKLDEDKKEDGEKAEEGNDDHE